MSKGNELSRRGFLQGAATAGTVGAAAPHSVSNRALGGPVRCGANDRIQIGLIGAGGMGRANLRNCAKHPGVVVTGVCDVWKARRDAAVAEYKASATAYHDFREMLQRKDIDAVIIATPPHWHCLQAVEACEAGKDIYLQKPMTLHVAESLAVKRAVEKHERISQVGTQIHASENYRRVVEWIRSGKFGPIAVVRTFNVQNQGPQGIGDPPDSDPPTGLDWERWLGPAPKRAYNKLLARSSFYHCSFVAYSARLRRAGTNQAARIISWMPIVERCRAGKVAPSGATVSGAPTVEYLGIVARCARDPQRGFLLPRRLPDRESYAAPLRPQVRPDSSRRSCLLRQRGRTHVWAAPLCSEAMALP